MLGHQLRNIRYLLDNHREHFDVFFYHNHVIKMLTGASARRRSAGRGCRVGRGKALVEPAVEATRINARL